MALPSQLECERGYEISMSVDEKRPGETVFTIDVINLQDCEKRQSSRLGDLNHLKWRQKIVEVSEWGQSRQCELVKSCLLR